jgi:hypothetical protein
VAHLQAKNKCRTSGIWRIANHYSMIVSTCGFFPQEWGVRSQEMGKHYNEDNCKEDNCS